jgi:hypothetical protein
MNFKEIIYFKTMINYKSKGINKISSNENLEEIYLYSSRIRETARYALSEEISPKKAKREISDLLDNIKELKKGAK